MEEALKEILKSLIEQYPVLSSALFGIGLLRAINKPLFALVRAYVEYTLTKKDDEILNKIEESKPYRVIVFLLDWFTSIKVK